MRDDYTRLTILESLLQDLQSQIASKDTEIALLKKERGLHIAQIQDLQYGRKERQDTIEDLEDEVSSLKDDAAVLEEAAKDDEGEINDLRSQVFRLEDKIRDLEKELKKR